MEERVGKRPGSERVPFAVTCVNHTKQVGKLAVKEEDRERKPFLGPPELSVGHTFKVVLSEVGREPD